MKKIAIMIQNIIQWYSVKPLVELLSQKPDIKTDILIFDPQKTIPAITTSPIRSAKPSKTMDLPLPQSQTVQATKSL